MPRFFDRVKETSTTTGIGDFTLAGAASQHVAFSTVFTVGDEQIPYAIVGQTGTEWEVGYGTYSASNTLRRDEVLASSNSNNAVTFSAGTKDVWVNAGATAISRFGKNIAVARGMALP